MINIVKAKKYLIDVEANLSAVLKDKSILTVLPEILPIPGCGDKTAKAVLVHVNTEHENVPSNGIIFFTATPIWTNAVYFYIRTKVLDKDAWISYAQDAHLIELKKYIRILKYSFK